MVMAKNFINTQQLWLFRCGHLKNAANIGHNLASTCTTTSQAGRLKATIWRMTQQEKIHN